MKVLEVFTEAEIIAFLEMARVAMSDADQFDCIAGELDLSDEEMCDLRERLQKFMKGGE